MLYDLFYVSQGTIDEGDWKKFHKRFPLARKIENVKSLKDIKSKSFTKFFWVVWDDLDVVDDSIFNYEVTEWDENYVHIFKNGEHYDGICIIPKFIEISDKEFLYRWFSEKKEINIQASTPKPYDIFYIDSYEEYLDALNKSKFDLFWMIGRNIKINEDFKFDMYFSYWDRQCRVQNHSFIHRVDGKDYYNAVFLLSKHRPVSQKEIEFKHLVEVREWPITASGPVKYDIFEITSFEDYQLAMKVSKTEMFWMTSSNIDTSDFDFDIYFTHNQTYDRNNNHAFIHRVNGKDHYNGVFLLSKNKPLSKKEIEFRHLIEVKEWPVVASGPVKYDIFEIDSYEEYEAAISLSKTEMFWMTSKNIDTSNFNFDLYFTHNEDYYDRYNNHAFIHRVNGKDYYNGVFLLSKNKPLSKKEIQFRHLIEYKEWPVVASGPVKYDIFEIDSYEEYESALKLSKTEMFWMTSRNIDTSNFNFDVYFTYDQIYDRNENHAFIHQIDNLYHYAFVSRENDKTFYNGVFLMSRKKPVTKKEIQFRHLIEYKEWPVVASGPVKYDIFEIDSYEEYQAAMSLSKTEMFWMTSRNIDTSNFNFDIYFTHDQIYDRNENHAFIHRFDDKDYYNGVFLLSKRKSVTKKEIEFRHLIEVKEWPVVASGPTEYDKFIIKNFDDYEKAYKESRTEMFWLIPNEVDVLDKFSFDLYFTHDQIYERSVNHTFKHLFRGEEIHNGIILASKKKLITKKEINFRYLIEKKEHDILASKVKPYDIVFISYNESNADVNYEKLKQRYPNAKRIHGVKGIHNAHIEAAKTVSTDMFWAIDADAEILENFRFDHEVSRYEIDCVHVWRSQNPINDLIYGYGGVKLLPTEKTMKMDSLSADMTTAISKNFKIMPEVSNVTRFNTDPFNTWKSAFRECVKLASKTIDRQVEKESLARLDIWCNIGDDRPFGEYAIEGAIAGRLYGELNKGNLEALAKINDFDWLKNKFDER